MPDLQAHNVALGTERNSNLKKENYINIPTLLGGGQAATLMLNVLLMPHEYEIKICGPGSFFLTACHSLFVNCDKEKAARGFVCVNSF